MTSEAEEEPFLSSSISQFAKIKFRHCDNYGSSQ